MEQERKPILPPYILLCLVAIVMAFAIAGVYTLTKDTIDAAALEAQMAARTAVMAEAYDMTELPLEEGDPVDYCYEAVDAAGNVIGYVSQITVTGFGGEIEVTVGMDMTGTITAINVGGSNFSETSGLGAKTREAAFTDQFKGMSGMLVLKQNIDSVTGASVSSGAVVSGVNKALTYMTALLPEGSVATTAAEPVELTAEELAQLAPDAASAEWMGDGMGIDGWWQTDNGGYVVRATAFGEGPIVVTLGFTADGVVTGIIIGDENFMETEGLGARVLEEAYWSQFIGLSGEQAYGEGVDAISGATVTSTATLEAINVCLTFDPQNPGTVVTTTTTTTAADAQTSASVEEEAAAVEPDPNPPVAAEEPDAQTSASVEEEEPAATEAPDAQTEASVVEEEPTVTPTPEPVDAVAEASVVEEAEATPEPTPVPTEEPDAETSASVTEEEEVTPTPEPTPDAVAEASIKE